MSDMTAIFEALAVLAEQCREQAEEITKLKSIVRLHDERIDAHGLLLTTPRRRDVLRHYEDQLAGLKEAT